MKFDPDLVTVAVNTSDINDIVTRGGKERFLDDGAVQYAEPPGDEWLFELSHLYRFITKELLGYDWNGLSRSERKRRKAQAIVKLGAVLGDFQNLATRERFKFVVILHPGYHEVMKERYSFDPGELTSYLQDADIQFVDLMPYFAEIVPLGKEAANSLFWERDYHYNAEGYRRFAAGIEAYLREHDVIPHGLD